MYSEYLSWSGFRIEVCEEGLEAFGRAVALRPDLVCASFVMSNGTGAELCTALHADPRTSRIPVIILTTLTSAIEMQAARASGCEALLIKPCLPEDLAAEATRLIADGRRSQRNGHAAKVRSAASRR